MNSLSFLPQFLQLAPPQVSFEFFPPKTPEMELNLWAAIKALEPLAPRFVSVTYGAGGSTRERTHETVKRIKQETTLTPAAHLTCVGHSRAEIEEIARDYLTIGVNHIVALRGDPPEGNKVYQAHEDGYHYAIDLVRDLSSIGNFDISVAAFPEGHPETSNAAKDIDHLKAKIDAGANRAITQYFFDTSLYLDFLEKARKSGIKVPLVPGIILVANYKQLLRFSALAGATVPKWIGTLLEELDAFPERRELVSMLIASEQCRILREAGIEEFHFYTLNRPTIAASLCHVLGLRPEPGV